MTWETQRNRTQQKQARTWAQKHLPMKCTQCGATTNLELDHKKNLAKGGTHNHDNLQWLCKTCHMRKTQKEAASARNGWKRPKETHPGHVRGGGYPKGA